MGNSDSDQDIVTTEPTIPHTGTARLTRGVQSEEDDEEKGWIPANPPSRGNKQRRSERNNGIPPSFAEFDDHPLQWDENEERNESRKRKGDMSSIDLTYSQDRQPEDDTVTMRMGRVVLITKSELILQAGEDSFQYLYRVKRTRGTAPYRHVPFLFQTKEESGDPLNHFGKCFDTRMAWDSKVVKSGTSIPRKLEHLLYTGRIDLASHEGKHGGISVDSLLGPQRFSIRFYRDTFPKAIHGDMVTFKAISSRSGFCLLLKGTMKPLVLTDRLGNENRGARELHYKWALPAEVYEHLEREKGYHLEIGALEMDLLEKRKDDEHRGLPANRIIDTADSAELRLFKPTISDRLSNFIPEPKGKGILLNPSVFDCEPLLWTGLCERELEYPNSVLGKISVILPVSPLSNTDNFFLLNHPPFMESASVMRRVSKVTLILAMEGLGTFDNNLGSFSYEKGGTLFAKFDLEINKIDEREEYELPPVEYDAPDDEGYTTLSNATAFMDGTETDGGVVYRIPGKGGEIARAKHKAILDTGCLPHGTKTRRSVRLPLLIPKGGNTRFTHAFKEFGHPPRD